MHKEATPMNNIIRQWIRQAQTGDGEAVLAILQVFRPLLYKYARKYRYCYDSLDEALSTAHLAVLECIYSFELDGKEEGPAALRRAVQTAFRRENRHFKAYWQAVERMLFPQEERAEIALFRHSVCAFETAVQRIELQDELAPYLQCLTEQERRFLYLRYVKDYTFDTIGALHGLSTSQACKIVGQAVDKVKTKIKGDSLWPAVHPPCGKRNRIH